MYGFETLGVGFTVLVESVGDGEILQQGDDPCCPACGRDDRISCGKGRIAGRWAISLE